MQTRSGPPDEVIEVYVCNCGSYYGSSSMGKLEEQGNTDLKGEVTFTRDRCPDCEGKRQKRYARLIPKDEQTQAENEARNRLKGAAV
jgi:hypothetical protein